MKKDKIVITGIELLSPLGNSIESFWSGLINRKSGVGKVKQFPVDNDLYLCKIAAEVPEFQASTYCSDENLASHGRYRELALTVFEMVLESAGLKTSKCDLKKTDLFFGSAQQTGDTMEAFMKDWVKGYLSELPQNINSLTDPFSVISEAAAMSRTNGKVFNITSSCSSGALALMLCVEYLRAKQSEIGIVVGADAISPVIFLGEGLTGELSRRNNEPEKASRPFDRDQDGYVIGEGAVAIVVETEFNALTRGAKIYAELGPIYSTSDATSFKYIDESGTQMARGISKLLSEVPPEKIDYINAHAPSIKSLDTMESLAIRKSFGSLADKIPVTSIKGAIGNPSAAGALLQLVSGVLSIHNNIIPPTLNLENPLPKCNLNYVKFAQEKNIDTVLVSAHGGGGVNVAFTLHAYN